MCKNKNELRSVVAKYRRLKAQKSSIEEQIKECEAEMYDYFDRHDINPKEKVHGQNFTISFGVCKQSWYDSEALQRTLGSRLDKFKKYTVYKRLYVK